MPIFLLKSRTFGIFKIFDINKRLYLILNVNQRFANRTKNLNKIQQHTYTADINQNANIKNLQCINSHASSRKENIICLFYSCKQSHKNIYNQHKIIYYIQNNIHNATKNDKSIFSEHLRDEVYTKLK